MLAVAFAFFVLALIAASLGFFGLAASAAWIAKFMFFACLAVAVISLFTGLVRRRRTA